MMLYNIIFNLKIMLIVILVVRRSWIQILALCRLQRFHWASAILKNSTFTNAAVHPAVMGS